MKLASTDKLRDTLKAKMNSKSLSIRKTAAQIGLAPRTIAKILHPEKERYGLSMGVWNKVMAWKPRVK